MARRLGKHNLKHQQPRSHHNRAVGHVEGWPLVWTYIEEQKIHNVTADQAIPQITDRATENQRQPDASRGQAVTVFPVQRGDDQQRDYRKKDKIADFPFEEGISKNTKSCTR